MRRVLLVLVVGGGVFTAGLGANAMPVASLGPIPTVSASVQQAQYRGHDRWRHRHHRHWRHRRYYR